MTCLESRLWSWILILPVLNFHSADSEEEQLKSLNSLAIGVGSAHFFAAIALFLGSSPIVKKNQS